MPAANQSSEDSKSRQLCARLRGLLALAWHNIPVDDEKAFSQDFLAHSFQFARIATWGAAIVGTISAAWRAMNEIESASLTVLIAANWAPVAFFMLFGRWSRTHFPWVLDVVWASFFILLLARLHDVSSTVADVPLLIADTQKSLVLMVIFPIVFSRLPFQHGVLVVGTGTVAAVSYATWLFSLQDCFQLILNTSIALVLALGVSWAIEARERILDRERHKLRQLSAERDELNRKLHHEADSLRQLSSERDQLIRALHHDANNALFQMGSTLLALRELCDARQDFESLRVPLTRLRGVVDQIDGMTRGMYDLVRAGEFQPSIGPLSVTEIVCALKVQHTPAAEAKGLLLQMRETDTDVYVDTDRAALQHRILGNLLSNAIKYTYAGMVTISWRVVNDRVRFEVTDTGPGIPEDKHQDIFKEFVRNVHTNENAPAGLGLGLAIVSLLCKKLSYPLGLSSTLGQGSTFWLEVPLAVDPPVPVSGPALVSGLPRDKRYLVVVDDEAGVRSGLAAVLSSAGYNVAENVKFAESVATVRQVIGQAPDREPSAVVCDFRLQDGETALDVMAVLDDSFSWTRIPVPVVVLSAEISPALGHRRHTVFVRKTGSVGDVVPALEQVIAAHREQQRLIHDEDDEAEPGAKCLSESS